MRDGASEAFAEEERLFHAALALPPTQRLKFLETQSGGDPGVVRAVLELLDADACTGAKLDVPVIPRSLELVASDRIGEMFAGRYRLVEKLGEGGWGTVFRAEQSEPVRREVAVKVLKAGMDTRAVVTRFRAEQQALARMDHPGIARVFDAGETIQGRPFFVMELVRGRRITEFCDARRMTVRERLELFVKVCEAVQHAHHKGVVHRDLKPSNILVEEVVGAAVPKVIDFGIAKAVTGRLGEDTLVTEVGGFMGTPAYMAPEQAEGRAEAADTRTDVYGLGALLYELAAGRTPLAGEAIGRAGRRDVREHLFEAEPQRPSVRIRSLSAAEQEEVAARRRTTGRALAELLQGDLDVVILRCLEKETARRYDSASALAEDVVRWLKDEPIMARPASGLYVLRKFVRRHRLAFGAAATVLLLLLSGVMASTVLLFREKAALERAVAAEREQARARSEAEQASRVAKIEAARSAEVTRFMSGMLRKAAPALSRGRDTELLREVLDDTAERLASLKGQPEVEADLSEIVSGVFWSLGEYPEALKRAKRALVLREQTLGTDHLKVAETLMRIADYQTYQAESREAEQLYRRALQIRKEALGEDDPATADTMQALSRVLTHFQRYEEAKTLVSRALEVQSRTLPPTSARLLRTKYTLGALSQNMGQPEEAMRLYREIVAASPNDAQGQPPNSLKDEVLASIARRLCADGKIDEGIAAYREAIATAAKLGQRAIKIELQLAGALHRVGRFDEALALLPEIVKVARARAPREINRRLAEVLDGAVNLWGQVLVDAGRYAEAEPILREACAQHDEPTRFVVNHPAIPLASALTAQGRSDEAEAVLREAVRKGEAGRNIHFYGLAVALHERLVTAGRGAEAAEIMQRRVRNSHEWVARLGERDAAPFVVAVLCAGLQAGEFAAVEEQVRQRLTWWEAEEPNADAAHAYRAVLGESLLMGGRWAEAEPMLARAATELERGIARLPRGMLHAAERVGRALARLQERAGPAADER